MSTIESDVIYALRNYEFFKVYPRQPLWRATVDDFNWELEDL